MHLKADAVKLFWSAFMVYTKTLFTKYLLASVEQKKDKL